MRPATTLALALALTLALSLTYRNTQTAPLPTRNLSSLLPAQAAS